MHSYIIRVDIKDNCVCSDKNIRDILSDLKKIRKNKKFTNRNTYVNYEITTPI